LSNYPLRFPETLMEDARAMAKAQGVPINQCLATMIAERVGQLKALQHVSARTSPADQVW
jgi:hypothetical protein